jgi:hypothetical protein
MSYLKLSTMQYPLYEGDIRLEYPKIKESQTGDSFPIPDGYVYIVEIEPPTNLTKGQYVVSGAPVQVEGVWQQTWVIQSLTEEEINAVETERAEVLAAEAAKMKMPTSVSGSAPDVI